MDSELPLGLVALGALVVVLVIYATVRMLIARHQLYEKVKVLTGLLEMKLSLLERKWGEFQYSLRLRAITYVPPGENEKAETRRREIEDKLEKVFKASLPRKIRSRLQKGRGLFLAQKPVVLKVVGPVDWPFWVFWKLVYAVYGLINWSFYSVLLLWPTHTMRRLKRRLDYLGGLERELDEATKSVQDLLRLSRLITEDRAAQAKKKAEAKKKAQEIAQKRLVFEGVRRKLVENLEYHLMAPSEEILCGASLLDLSAARLQWGADLPRFIQHEPEDSDLDRETASWQVTLSVFERISVVKGSQSISNIQRYADRIAESERLIRTAEEAFRERLTFSAIAVAPEEPAGLKKARSLLSEAASHWTAFGFDRLRDLANTADDYTKQAMQNVADLKGWEDIILAFDKKRADIKENEDALLAYGVEIPQTSDWQTAVETLEGEVPQVWASYNWSRLNELNEMINDAFTARAQEVNRRLEAELNKRVARGQAVPEGAKRQSQAASPATESAPLVPSNGNSGQKEKAGKLRIRYLPDPEHMEPLVSVRSKTTGVILEVAQSLAVDGTYIIVNPQNLEEPLVWARSNAGVYLQVAQSLAVSDLYRIVPPNDPELLRFLQKQPGK